jgi:hypothetical protein
MGYFTSAFEICLVVTNNNHEETIIEHLFIDLYCGLLLLLDGSAFYDYHRADHIHSLYQTFTMLWMLCLSFG